MNGRPHGIEWVECVLADDRYRKTFGIPEWVDWIGLEWIRDESTRVSPWIPWTEAPRVAFLELHLHYPERLSEPSMRGSR